MFCTRDGTEAVLRNILSQAVSGALQLSLARQVFDRQTCFALPCITKTLKRIPLQPPSSYNIFSLFIF